MSLKICTLIGIYIIWTVVTCISKPVLCKTNIIFVMERHFMVFDIIKIVWLCTSNFGLHTYANEEIPITIRIILIWVWSFGTIVIFVQDTVIVHVRITRITQPISIGIFLVEVWQQWAIVTSISSFIITICLCIRLHA